MIFIYRWAWLLLLVFFSFTAIYSSGIDAGSSHDKLKYLTIAWSMFQSGHYLVPMVNGVPYTDKPPLLFWLMTGAWHLFGVNMFSLQCLIDLILISWGLILRAIYRVVFPGDKLGKNLIPYMLIGSYAVWRDMWFLRVDILLLTGVLLCNLGILKVIANAQIKRAYFYIALGTCVGLFSKGPIVYVFTLLPFLVCVTFTKNYRQYFSRIIGTFLLGTVFFLLTWVIPAILTSSHNFAKQLVYQQIAHRALRSDKSYFIYIYQYIPILFFPWIFNLFFYKKFAATFQQIPQYRSFIISIIIVSIITFSCFGQKSLWYILPILPFGLIFFTRFFVENRDQIIVARFNRVILSVIFVSFGILSISLLLSPIAQAYVFKNFGGHFLFSPSVMVAFTVVSFITFFYLCFLKSNVLRLVSVASVMLLLVYSFSNLYFFSFEKKYTQINEIAAYLRAQELSKQGIALYKSDYLGQFTYAGRLNEIIPKLNAPNILKNWLEKNPQGIVLYLGKNCPSFSNLHLLIAYNESARSTPFLLCQR